MFGSIQGRHVLLLSMSFAGGTLILQVLHQSKSLLSDMVFSPWYRGLHFGLNSHDCPQHFGVDVAGAFQHQTLVYSRQIIYTKNSIGFIENGSQTHHGTCSWHMLHTLTPFQPPQA